MQGFQKLYKTKQFLVSRKTQPYITILSQYEFDLIKDIMEKNKDNPCILIFLQTSLTTLLHYFSKDQANLYTLLDEYLFSSLTGNPCANINPFYKFFLGKIKLVNIGDMSFKNIAILPLYRGASYTRYPYIHFFTYHVS